MPDPTRVLNTLCRAVQAFQQTPGRCGRFVSLDDAEEILVAGDLHGNITNFQKILQLAQLAETPRRHLVLQEVIHGPHRYPVGGDQSHRMLDLVAALKCQFPCQVHVLIGNHELSQVTDRAIVKNDQDLNALFRQGVEAAYGDASSDVYEAYRRLIAAMPVALRTSNRVFLSHSLPGSNRLDSWELPMLFREDWSEEDVKLGGAIHAVVWGKDASEVTAVRFLAKVDADWLVSGHIPCEQGYCVPNSRQLILDSTDKRGCVCQFSGQAPMTLETLVQGVRRLHAEQE